MKEIRLHGRGGQGVVKASHIVVKAAVGGGTYGQFIPFFGVERKGSPVFGFLRLSQMPIRRKTQIYRPDILMIFDDSLVGLPATYAGLKDGGMVIINSTKTPEELGVPAQAGRSSWWTRPASPRSSLAAICRTPPCSAHWQGSPTLWTKSACLTRSRQRSASKTALRRRKPMTASSLRASKEEE